VYLSDNFEGVNDGTGDAFRGNQTSTFYVAGFPGFAYPDGLVPGTTYYWRIDEVNDADPNSPWRGSVWSFSIPPKKAYAPVPADGAESVAVDVKLSWTPGHGAKLHTVYFGTDLDTVTNAAGGLPQGTATYTPSGLKLAKTYFWRVDEFDGAATHKGDVWSFATRGAIGNPNPANGAVNVRPTQLLTWRSGDLAASHEVYFGTEADAVKNATKASPEYKVAKPRGDESYDPGKLALLTAYYWRVDEVNGVNADSPWKGNVWSFTTGDFFVLDDFEDYDAGASQIWYSWHDGLGYGAPGAPPYFAGNGTGSAVGNENTASFTEETIVHGGRQSMPLAYDNNKQGFAKYSEAELTLAAQRDWTEEGIGELSIWFRGLPGSVGSFAEAPAGTYTMTSSGTDIWDVGTAGTYHDEFHFAYKTLTGAGSIVAKVQSVQNTNGWAKAGVMIRETLDGGSKHAFACVTPSNGVASQGRDTTGAASFNTNQTGVAAPYWVRLERDAAGNFTVSHSANGTAWQPVTGATPRNIPMSSTVYIGLALTAHNANATCRAVFTNVTTTGTVSPQWAHQDIGIASNAAEPLYVAGSSAAGQPAVVAHPDPAAAQIATWTEWVIPLQSFADKGINLANVDRIAIGLGTRGNMTTPGGSGKMYFDDIRLYQPRTAP
jgi:regulation of enolase protein 1 (concanavalin A-like superfamily)